MGIFVNVTGLIVMAPFLAIVLLASMAHPAAGAGVLMLPFLFMAYRIHRARKQAGQRGAWGVLAFVVGTMMFLAYGVTAGI